VDNLATPIGHELHVSLGGYNYEEPGDLSISIHGLKFGAGYTGTASLNENRHLFAQVDARAVLGNVTYDGWCSPYLITPDSTSPNGYFLDLGDASPCSESGDRDWYIEARGLVGRDFIRRAWAFAPDAGLGIRRISNGTAGLNGYRTDDYLYLPLGLTARTIVGTRHALSVSVEYDRLLRGWQKTRDSQFGGGQVPATSIAPAFTIDRFTDVSFEQHHGWGLRAGAKYQLTPHWSIEPEYVHWSVEASQVNFETVSFTVNGITALEDFGAYEPDNTTNEFAVRLGFRF
jgi:opacity protein-like surface antigen